MSEFNKDRDDIFNTMAGEMARGANLWDSTPGASVQPAANGLRKLYEPDWDPSQADQKVYRREADWKLDRPEPEA